MVAKGLDFERVNLVGIINGDASFSRLDFSSNEVGYDLLEQASGRSGRNQKQGKCIFKPLTQVNLYFNVLSIIPIILFSTRNAISSFRKLSTLLLFMFNYLYAFG